MKKLSELVKSALDEASTKIASVHDVPVEGTPKIAEAQPPAPPVTSVVEKRANILSTAKEAMKFAESLEHLAILFPKLANASKSTMDVSGPEILTSPTKGVTKDTSTKATTLTAAEASHGGGGGSAAGEVANDGGVGGVPNRFSKKAAEEMLLAKLAQSSALLAAGQAQQATKLAQAAQAEFERLKQAYEEEDGSTRTPKGSPKSLETYVSGMTGAPGGVAPDNKSVASFTKRDGKKREIGPLAEHLREPAFSARSDRGIQDNFEHTQGAKIAEMINAVAARKSAGRTA